MNALQISPLGATAPPTSPGKDPVAVETLLSPLKTKATPKPDSTASGDTDQQLAEARSNTVGAADERKAQVDKAQAEKAKAAKEAAEARKKAEAEAVTVDIGTFDREVGLVEGTTKVFVDLVDPESKASIFRVFGPPEAEPVTEPPSEPRPAPAGATNAYTLAGANLPLKDLGVA